MNERQALVVAGQLLNLDLAENAMCQMVGITRSKLLVLAGGFSRLLASQSQPDIIKTLSDELTNITAELRTDLPTDDVEVDYNLATQDESEEE